MYLEKHNTNNFDLIRFLAVSAVMYSNSNIVTNSNGDIWNFITNYQDNVGGLGLSVLLMLSGFLTLASYDRLQNAKKYLYARALGIYPQLIVFILLSVFIIGPLVTEVSLKEYFASSEVWAYLLNILLPFTNERYTLVGCFSQIPLLGAMNNLFWVIAIVVKCYLLVTVLYATGVMRFRYLILISWIILIVASVMKPSPYSIDELYIYFGSGMLFWLFRDKIKYNLINIVAAILILLMFGYFGKYWEIIFPILGAYLLFSFAFSTKIKLYNFGKYGDFSYGVFLYGLLVQKLVISIVHGQMNGLLNYVISLPLAVLCGIVSYKLIEHPVTNFKKRIL